MLFLSSFIHRAKLIGQRLYYGALLLPPSKQTKSINEEDMKKFSSTLSSELTYALLNNYSYQEYCQLERSLIPQWLEEKEEKKASEWINEDLSWLQITEEEQKSLTTIIGTEEKKCKILVNDELLLKDNITYREFVNTFYNEIKKEKMGLV